MTVESDRVRSLGGGSRIPVRAVLILAALAAMAALAILSAPVEAQGSAIRAATFAAGIAATWWVLGRSAAVTASSPERFDVELREPPVVVPEIVTLRNVETNLRMSAADTLWLELRLKPLLRELAAWRLATNRGVDIDASPDVARRILGETLWRLSHPAAERPEPHAPRLSLADARAAIDQLEGV